MVTNFVGGENLVFIKKSIKNDNEELERKSCSQTIFSNQIQLFDEKSGEKKIFSKNTSNSQYFSQYLDKYNQHNQRDNISKVPSARNSNYKGYIIIIIW